MNRTIYILIFLFLISCNPFQESFYISDNCYLESRRSFSPDSSMVLLDYCSDGGALGSGVSRTAILKVADMSKNLIPFSLPAKMINAKWIDNKTISAQIDFIPIIRSGSKVFLKDTVVNNIKVKISEYYFIDCTDSSFHLDILKRETSPNGKYDFVAYRYSDRHNIGFVQISVILNGGQIPKYGNYFIADSEGDVILDATWNKNNELVFYSTSDWSDLMNYYLVKGRPDINYRFIVDTIKFRNRIYWKKKSGL